MAVEKLICSELGAKHDAGKILFRPLFALYAQLRLVAEVLTFGARKYAYDSWKHVPNGEERYTDAFYRHHFARLSGETHDPESGLPHIAHEICNLLFIAWFQRAQQTMEKPVDNNHASPYVFTYKATNIPAGYAGEAGRGSGDIHQDR